MGFFESLFYTIWRGVAIGILISAPMGPVGILCIQRTLYKGRKAGLYTGIGAALSDLFYCILTGFGLSFIEEFLERNQNVIQLAGSAVLIAFAVYLFKKNPASSLKTLREEETQVSPHKNILGGFLFTFSNPLILFLIIGLFARFNFSIPEISFYYYIAGYIAIFFGAVLWWEFVTFSVNKLRSHFNLRSMYLINRIIGVIILLFALVGIITGISNLASAKNFYWNEGRGYLPFEYASADGIIIDNPSDSIRYSFRRLEQSSEDFSIEFRARNLHGNPSGNYHYTSSSRNKLKVDNPHWGFFITTASDTITFSVKKAEKPNLFETVDCLRISAYSYATGHTENKDISGTVNTTTGENIWYCSISSGGLDLMAGNKYLYPVMKMSGIDEVTGFGFFAGWGGKLKINDIIISEADPQKSEEITFSEETLKNYLDLSDDPIEGYWVLFDRDFEESLLKCGGDYILAAIREGEGYVFIYIDGAQVNAKGWKAGDRKAVLCSTPFEDIYDVEWLDAMKNPFNKDIKAQIGEGNTLIFRFPYQSSSFRLRKLPKLPSSTTTASTGASTPESSSNSASATSPRP